MSRPVTIITGASAGIGAALARVFAAGGHELLLVARREPELNALADDIASKGAPRPHVLSLDLSLPGASERIANELTKLDREAQFVVNNAGFGLLGPAAGHDRDRQLSMIDLNVRTLADLSLAFIDSIARQQGGILNVASVAGFLPGPHMAVYYATKAFVLSFSEALHLELAPRGIRVSVLCPGTVPTEFQERAGIPVDMGFDLLRRDADAVALAGYRGLMAGQRCIVPGWANYAATFFLPFFPRGMVLRLVERAQARRMSTDTAE